MRIEKRDLFIVGDEITVARNAANNRVAPRLRLLSHTTNFLGCQPSILVFPTSSNRWLIIAYIDHITNWNELYIYIIYIYNYVVDVNAIFIVFSVISVVVVVRIAFYFVKFLLLDLPVLHFPH